ncbi:MAG: class I SAM-dependent RNA methyltransferase [Alphaproteobacteria bacterium]|nr:class I SAM-dependent RNA methyltransferase [Alphaproteobacteria bacterium]
MPRKNKPVPIQTQLKIPTLKITSLGGRGDGIGEVDGKKVFVPFALPGETVRALVSGNRAVVEDVLEPSPDRIDALCRHFTHCGGCALQHLGGDSYRIWKKGIVETALANRGLEDSVENLIDAHGIGRRRVTVHVRFSKGEIKAGFMQARSHDLLDIDVCPVLAPDLERAFDTARCLAAPFQAKGEGLDVQITATQSGLDCDIRFTGKTVEPDLDTRMDLADIATDRDLARVTVQGEIIVERRPPALSIGAGRVVPPPGGFLQATLAGEQTLAGLVLEYAGDAKKVADLFCGIGPFALRLADKASVLAADADEAQIAALANAVRYCQGLKPVTAEVRDLFRNPFRSDELNGFDCVVFDPPRAGAEAQVREIAATNIPAVIAVSCDPVSFARDAEILMKSGYRLERVTPIDQFKYTAHVEIVAVFQRG